MRLFTHNFVFICDLVLQNIGILLFSICTNVSMFPITHYLPCGCLSSMLFEKKTPVPTLQKYSGLNFKLMTNRKTNFFALYITTYSLNLDIIYFLKFTSAKCDLFTLDFFFVTQLLPLTLFLRLRKCVNISNNQYFLHKMHIHFPY